jgi:hypothetical protein
MDLACTCHVPRAQARGVGRCYGRSADDTSGATTAWPVWQRAARRRRARAFDVLPVYRVR